MNPVRELKKIATELESLQRDKEAQSVKSLTEVIRQMAELIHDNLDSSGKIDQFAPGAIQEALISLGLDKTSEGKKLLEEFGKAE